MRARVRGLSYMYFFSLVGVTVQEKAAQFFARLFLSSICIPFLVKAPVHETRGSFLSVAAEPARVIC